MSKSNGDGSQSAEQQAYSTIKSQILNMDYMPGEYISDGDVATELGLSRTPVLYALRYLEFEGLVTRQPRQGWQVCGLSMDDIHDIFNIKEALSVMIVRQAAQCEESELRKNLQDACNGMLKAHRADDLEAWEIAHRDWHTTLNSMSTYPDSQAFRFMGMLNDQWRRVRTGLLAIDGRMERETHEHCHIAEAVLSGDTEEAETRMFDHLKSVRNDLVNLLTHMVLPFAPHGV